MDCNLFNDMYQLQQLFSVKQYESAIVFSELERNGEEAVVAYFKTLSCYLPGGNTWKTSVRMADVPPKIWTDHLPNTSQKHYC